MIADQDIRSDLEYCIGRVEHMEPEAAQRVMAQYLGGIRWAVRRGDTIEPHDLVQTMFDCIAAQDPPAKPTP